jgi:conflict system STAND superfamily ATPase/SIR2-like protein
VTAADPESPYKFLHPYEFDDEQLFFGRDEEIKVLVADVVVSRLVVLFAPTGTGKTSLINAGVRPVLERRGYATFYVRVSRDPVRSARAILAAEADCPIRPKLSFDRQLVGLAHDLGTEERPLTPIVVFFDQFEEFFLYAVRDELPKAQRFVASIARLLEDEDTPIHVVFALREEFLGEMDFFREAIPTIFHADSNLRLRWFERAQARAAITGPVDGRIDPDLERRLIADLAATGRSAGGPEERPIEPAQLQIVCDTIWRRSARRNGSLTLDDYLKLATPGHGGTVAQQILDLRLAEQLEQLEKHELELLDRVLDKLRTDRGTKWVREVNELAEAVGATRKEVSDLLQRLRQASLVRVEPRGRSVLVELVHDYLAETARMEGFRRAVRTARPRRFMREARSSGELLGGDEIREVIAAAAELGLDAGDCELVLRSALTHGLSVEPALPVLEASGAPVWELFAERIEKGDEAEAAAVIESLSALRRPEAANVLVHALERPPLAARIISLLGYAEHTVSVDLLASALPNDDLRAEVLKALARLARPHVPQRVAARSRSALTSFYKPRLREQRTAATALAELSAVETEVAVQLAADCLRVRRLRPDAIRALAALARSSRREVAARALDVLRSEILKAGGDDELTKEQVEALPLLPSVEAVEILAYALEHGPFRDEAAAGLRLLSAAGDPQVSAAADQALAAHDPKPPPLAAAAAPMPLAPPPVAGSLLHASPPTSPAALESHHHLLARRIADGRVVPLLGAGVSLAGRTSGTPWTLAHAGFPSGRELAEHLAAIFFYPTDEPLDLLRVAQYVELTAGRGPLYEELRRVFETRSPPTLMHRTLARLPLQVVFETNYDDGLERALEKAARDFDVLTYMADGPWSGRFRLDRTDGESIVLEAPNRYADLDPKKRLVVVRLYGRLDRRDPSLDSFVITEDDHLDAAARRMVEALPPHVLSAAVSSSFLFLGSSLRDWSLRLLLRSLRRDKSLRFKSWAVVRSPPALDVEYWHRQDVEVLDVGLDEYAAGLERTFAQM